MTEVTDYYQCVIEIITRLYNHFLARDATDDFNATHHSDEAKEKMQTFFIGNYVDVSVISTVIQNWPSSL